LVGALAGALPGRSEPACGLVSLGAIAQLVLSPGFGFRPTKLLEAPGYGTTDHCITAVIDPTHPDQHLGDAHLHLPDGAHPARSPNAPAVDLQRHKRGQSR